MKMNCAKLPSDLGRKSNIVNFYKNKSIFITGASGFIGKVLVEKLIRTCPELKKIYILLRTKKGLSIEQRLEQEFVKNKLYEHLDKNLILSKIEPLDGNLISENLGLSEENQQILIDNVNIIFHVAASVRFDDPLKECLRYNVLGTKYVLEISKNVKNLESFVHVSTAYAYCHMKRSEECLYPLKATANQVIDACNWMDDKTLKDNSKFLMEDRPNTYTFTKALAEHFINDSRGQLPIAIARPSIVIASNKEPFSGWIDSINGPSGAALLGTLGIARSMYCKPKNTADLIPVDIVANSLIVIAWKTALDKNEEKTINNNNNKESDLPIYNITTGDVNPTTWEKFLEYGREVACTMPSIKMVRLPASVPRGENVNLYGHLATKVFSETLFAYLVDFILLLIGHKAIMVRLVRKMHNAFQLLEYFATRQWSFPCDNLLKLYDSLNDVDQKLFDFDIRKLDWRVYTLNFYIGIRRHLMKEDDDNVPKALKRMQRLKIAYAVVDSILVILFVVFFLWLIPLHKSNLSVYSLINS